MPPSLNAVPADVQRLADLRRSRSSVLVIVVAGFYAIVALACAFAPAVLARPLFSGASNVSIGLVLMAMVVALAIVASGYYTWWSNAVRDPAIARAVAARRRAGD